MGVNQESRQKALGEGSASALLFSFITRELSKLLRGVDFASLPLWSLYRDKTLETSGNTAVADRLLSLSSFFLRNYSSFFSAERRAFPSSGRLPHSHSIWMRRCGNIQATALSPAPMRNRRCRERLAGKLRFKVVSYSRRASKQTQTLPFQPIQNRIKALQWININPHIGNEEFKTLLSLWNPKEVARRIKMRFDSDALDCSSEKCATNWSRRRFIKRAHIEGWSSVKSVRRRLRRYYSVALWAEQETTMYNPIISAPDAQICSRFTNAKSVCRCRNATMRICKQIPSDV